jgi:GGDEF domain-containing protein
MLMAEHKSKAVFDDEVRAFLEDVSAASLPEQIPEADILAQAPAYNIDLDGLEDTQNVPAAAVTAQAEAAYRDDKTVPADNFEEIDIKLSDVVSKIFEQSHRPYVIVCDDKVEYMNRAALDLVGASEPAQVLHHNFFEFVIKEDWNKLAENIGVMLTDNAEVQFMMKSPLDKVSKVKMRAIYVPDSQHFSFILVGVPPETNGQPAGNVVSMFDALTGLPNFYLFEDRVQVAVNNENYKDVRQARNMIAVLGVSLDNLQNLKQAKMDEFVIKKLASRLVLGLPRHYTVARGLKYQFWVMMNDISSEAELEVEAAKVRAMFDEPVADNFTEHFVHASIGISVFPRPAKSAKKLIEQSIAAVGEAQKRGNVPYVVYEPPLKIA